MIAERDEARAALSVRDTSNAQPESDGCARCKLCRASRPVRALSTEWVCLDFAACDARRRSGSAQAHGAAAVAAAIRLARFEAFTEALAVCANVEGDPSIDYPQENNVIWTRIEKLRSAANPRDGRRSSAAPPDAWKDEDDKPLPEDDEIKAAFPTRSGRDDLYGEAMRLVGARYSKGGLVALVNMLLHRSENLLGAIEDYTKLRDAPGLNKRPDQDLTRLARWICQEADRAIDSRGRAPVDHACGRCVPGGSCVDPTFTCAVHMARDIIEAATPCASNPEETNHVEQATVDEAPAGAGTPGLRTEVREPRAMVEGPTMVGSLQSGDGIGQGVVTAARKASVEPTWFGVWCERDGTPGFWRTLSNGETLQTTPTEAKRSAEVLNQNAKERTDSLGWRYEAKPYVLVESGPSSGISDEEQRMAIVIEEAREDERRKTIEACAKFLIAKGRTGNTQEALYATRGAEILRTEMLFTSKGGA